MMEELKLMTTKLTGRFHLLLYGPTLWVLLQDKLNLGWKTYWLEISTTSAFVQETMLDKVLIVQSLNSLLQKFLLHQQLLLDYLLTNPKSLSNGHLHKMMEAPQ